MTVRKMVPLILACLLFTCGRVFANGVGENEQKVLTVWDFKYNDPRTRRVFTRVDNLFREKYPRVELEHKGFDEEEYIPALRAALLAGTAPDLIWLHHGTEFIEYQSYLMPLDEFLGQSGLNFRPLSLGPCLSEEGELKVLPLSFQGMGWYYNKDLFRQAGLDPENPPQKWEEFLEACRVLKENGIVPIASGNNRPLTTDFIRRSLITSFFSDEEIESFFQTGKGVISSRFRTIMQFCLDLRELEYLDLRGIFRPYFNFAGDSFGSGECAMIMGLLSDISHWQEFSDKLGKDNVGYFPNLMHPDMARPGTQLLQDAGIAIGINRNSENKELAYKYLEVLFSEKSQKLLIDDLGMLMPVADLPLPLDEYPVLLDIQAALEKTGFDIEQFTPSTYVRDLLYRYDRLLLNSREISLNDYLTRLYDYLKFF